MPHTAQFVSELTWARVNGQPFSNIAATIRELAGYRGKPPSEKRITHAVFSWLRRCRECQQSKVKVCPICGENPETYVLDGCTAFRPLEEKRARGAEDPEQRFAPVGSVTDRRFLTYPPNTVNKSQLSEELSKARDIVDELCKKKKKKKKQKNKAPHNSNNVTHQAVSPDVGNAGFPVVGSEDVADPARVNPVAPHCNDETSAVQAGGGTPSVEGTNATDTDDAASAGAARADTASTDAASTDTASADAASADAAGVDAAGADAVADEVDTVLATWVATNKRPSAKLLAALVACMSADLNEGVPREKWAPTAKLIRDLVNKRMSITSLFRDRDAIPMMALRRVWWLLLSTALGQHLGPCPDGSTQLTEKCSTLTQQLLEHGLQLDADTPLNVDVLNVGLDDDSWEHFINTLRMSVTPLCAGYSPLFWRAVSAVALNSAKLNATLLAAHCLLALFALGTLLSSVVSVSHRM